MATDWMTELASHYEKVRDQHPQDRLIILFDIDGTILDSRHLVHHVLQAFDEEHGTSFSRGFKSPISRYTKIK